MIRSQHQVIQLQFVLYTYFYGLMFANFRCILNNSSVILMLTDICSQTGIFFQLMVLYDFRLV